MNADSWAKMNYGHNVPYGGIRRGFYDQSRTTRVGSVSETPAELRLPLIVPSTSRPTTANDGGLVPTATLPRSCSQQGTVPSVLHNGLSKWTGHHRTTSGNLCTNELNGNPLANDNINNNNDITIYSAVITTARSLRKFSRFIWWMQNSAKAAADPQTKPPDLGCKSAYRLLSSTPTIAIYYYYSAQKLILIYRPTEGRRLSWPRHCRKGAHSPCPRL